MVVVSGVCQLGMVKVSEIDKDNLKTFKDNEKQKIR